MTRQYRFQTALSFAAILSCRQSAPKTRITPLHLPLLLVRIRHVAEMVLRFDFGFIDCDRVCPQLGVAQTLHRFRPPLRFHCQCVDTTFF